MTKKVAKKASKKVDEVETKGKKVAKKAEAPAAKKSAKKAEAPAAKKSGKKVAKKAEAPAAKKSGKKVAAKSAKKAKPEVKAMRPGRSKLNERGVLLCSPINEDLKPAWYEIKVTTEADGMFGSKITGRRFVGAIQPDKDERKVFDMAAYDEVTLRAILARLASVTFHATGRPNSKGVPSRLQPDTEYTLHIRLAITKENAIRAGVSKVFVNQTDKKGRVKSVMLDKKDYQVRKIRRVNKYLPVAFQAASMPPKPERRSRRQVAEDE